MEIVAQFEPFDKVPEWLLCISPANANSIPPEAFIFKVPVRVIEMAGHYWVLPRFDEWHSPVHCSTLHLVGEVKDLYIAAASKSVHVWSSGRLTFFGPDDEKNRGGGRSFSFPLGPD